VEQRAIFAAEAEALALSEAEAEATRARHAASTQRAMLAQQQKAEAARLDALSAEAVASERARAAARRRWRRLRVFFSALRAIAHPARRRTAAEVAAVRAAAISTAVGALRLARLLPTALDERTGRAPRTHGDEEAEEEDQHAAVVRELDLSGEAGDTVHRALRRLHALYCGCVRDPPLRAVELPRAARLCTLRLSRCGLRALPAPLFTLPTLRALWLDGNKLRALPRPPLRDVEGRAVCLAPLRRLVLRRNRLAELPDDDDEDDDGGLLGRLCATLRHLDVSHNALLLLPASALARLGGAGQLLTLDASHNALVGLPDALGALVALRSLRLEGNRLGELVAAPRQRTVQVGRAVARRLRRGLPVRLGAVLLLARPPPPSFPQQPTQHLPRGTARFFVVPPHTPQQPSGGGAEAAGGKEGGARGTIGNPFRSVSEAAVTASRSATFFAVVVTSAAARHRPHASHAAAEAEAANDLEGDEQGRAWYPGSVLLTSRPVGLHAAGMDEDGDGVSAMGVGVGVDADCEAVAPLAVGDVLDATVVGERVEMRRNGQLVRGSRGERGFYPTCPKPWCFGVAARGVGWKARLGEWDEERCRRERSLQPPPEFAWCTAGARLATRTRTDRSTKSVQAQDRNAARAGAKSGQRARRELFETTCLSRPGDERRDALDGAFWARRENAMAWDPRGQVRLALRNSNVGSGHAGTIGRSEETTAAAAEGEAEEGAEEDEREGREEVVGGERAGGGEQAGASEAAAEGDALPQPLELLPGVWVGHSRHSDLDPRSVIVAQRITHHLNLVSAGTGEDSAHTKVLESSSGGGVGGDGERSWRLSYQQIALMAEPCAAHARAAASLEPGSAAALAHERLVADCTDDAQAALPALDRAHRFMASALRRGGRVFVCSACHVGGRGALDGMAAVVALTFLLSGSAGLAGGMPSGSRLFEAYARLETQFCLAQPALAAGARRAAAAAREKEAAAAAASRRQQISSFYSHRFERRAFRRGRLGARTSTSTARAAPHHLHRTPAPQVVGSEGGVTTAAAAAAAEHASAPLPPTAQQLVRRAMVAAYLAKDKRGAWRCVHKSRGALARALPPPPLLRIAPLCGALAVAFEERFLGGVFTAVSRHRLASAPRENFRVHVVEVAVPALVVLRRGTHYLGKEGLRVPREWGDGAGAAPGGEEGEQERTVAAVHAVGGKAVQAAAVAAAKQAADAAAAAATIEACRYSGVSLFNFEDEEVLLEAGGSWGGGGGVTEYTCEEVADEGARTAAWAERRRRWLAFEQRERELRHGGDTDLLVSDHDGSGSTPLELALLAAYRERFGTAEPDLLRVRELLRMLPYRGAAVLAALRPLAGEGKGEGEEGEGGEGEEEEVSEFAAACVAIDAVRCMVEALEAVGAAVEAVEAVGAAVEAVDIIGCGLEAVEALAPALEAVDIIGCGAEAVEAVEAAVAAVVEVEAMVEATSVVGDVAGAVEAVVAAVEAVDVLGTVMEAVEVVSAMADALGAAGDGDGGGGGGGGSGGSGGGSGEELAVVAFAAWGAQRQACREWTRRQHEAMAATPLPGSALLVRYARAAAAAAAAAAPLAAPMAAADTERARELLRMFPAGRWATAGAAPEDMNAVCESIDVVRCMVEALETVGAAVEAVEAVEGLVGAVVAAEAVRVAAEKQRRTCAAADAGGASRSSSSSSDEEGSDGDDDGDSDDSDGGANAPSTGTAHGNGLVSLVLDRPFEGTSVVSSLPRGISQLTALRTLTLAHNGLASLPAELARLTGLRRLTLEGNSFDRLPPALLQLGKLCGGGVPSRSGSGGSSSSSGGGSSSSSSSSSAARFHTRRTAAASAATVVELRLPSNALRSLPRLPRRAPLVRSVRIVDLSDNALTQLPRSLGHLRRCRELLLSRNALRRLPNSVGALRRLETLLLAENALGPLAASLPSSLGRCTRLTWLDLRGNGLKGLPPALGRLPSLRKLDLRRNKLRSLPAELLARGGEEGGAPTPLARALVELLLDSNRLSSLPALPGCGDDDDGDGEGGLQRLERLMLGGNRLRGLPEEQLLKLHPERARQRLRRRLQRQFRATAAARGIGSDDGRGGGGEHRGEQQQQQQQQQQQAAAAALLPSSSGLRELCVRDNPLVLRLPEECFGFDTSFDVSAGDWSDVLLLLAVAPPLLYTVEAEEPDSTDEEV
jgi:Leucine-rich repeat (LRR) protein